MTIVIRAFREPDSAALASLVGPHTDPLWHDQFHTLHGPDSNEPWSRTLTAADTETGQIIGVATLSARTLHPARSACAIDVHPDHRRKGTGAALLQTLRSQFPNRFPAMTKVVASNTAAVSFLASSHATIYQVVPAFTIALSRTSPNPPFSLPPGIAITGLDKMPTEVLEDAFVSMYAWTYERWNPVSSHSDLRQAARHEVAEVARSLSSGAWKDGEPLAIAFVFPDGDGNAEIAAET
ncbi:MAG: GNAT family N-acetyltransferase, partial [Thermomicrobiales bacterium]